MRSEVNTIKQDLQNLTGVVWGFRDGQFVSQLTSPNIAERLMREEHLGATLIPNTTPGETRVNMALTFDAAQNYIEATRRERGRPSLG
jgi:hypothetical protein